MSAVGSHEAPAVRLAVQTPPLAPRHSNPFAQEGGSKVQAPPNSTTAAQTPQVVPPPAQSPDVHSAPSSHGCPTARVPRMSQTSTLMNGRSTQDVAAIFVAHALSSDARTPPSEESAWWRHSALL